MTDNTETPTERVVYAESTDCVYVYDHVNDSWEAWSRADDDRGGVGYGTQDLPGDAGPLYSSELWPHPEKVRADAADADLDKVRAFAADRAEYITAINNCHPDNEADYYRWQGHAEARRQLSALLDLPVAWPAEYAKNDEAEATR